PEDRDHLLFGEPRLLHGSLTRLRAPFSQASAGPKIGRQVRSPTTGPTAGSSVSITCPVRGEFGNGPTYYSQFYEDYILGYVFKAQKAGFYVDVGANDPDDASVTKYFYLAGWRGINIEPIPNLVAKLNTSRPEDVNRGVAISDTTGELTFYKAVRFSGLSTLDRSVAAEHKARGIEFQEIKVPVTTLSAVLDEHAKGRPEITFLNVDVEGLEQKVFSGLDFSRHRPRVIMAESTPPSPRSTRTVCGSRFSRVTATSSR
ncbi:MAG: FkbM family methyltransferase, partial [Acidimicrobiia bacterium]|nr:FkbM family methyltransferase [Acidimicrobiia bacterium]